LDKSLPFLSHPDQETSPLRGSQANQEKSNDLTEQGATKPLERIYQEASQWVRLVNTIIWSMGTLLVPVSFGLLGVALNK